MPMAVENEHDLPPFRIPALMYHHVAPELDDPFCVTPESFERQMRHAADRFRIMTVSEAIRRFHAGAAVDDDSLLLTFDDGYADFHEYAFPVLREFGLRATLYLATDHIGRTNIWNPKSPVISHHLTWDQVRSLMDCGMEIGGHSLTHHNLVKFGRDRIEQEVVGCADAIERNLGRRPISFAYPYGCFNELVRDVVADHYALAFSVDTGTFDWREDLFTIRRTYVGNEFEWSDLES